MSSTFQVISTKELYNSVRTSEVELGLLWPSAVSAVGSLRLSSGVSGQLDIDFLVGVSSRGTHSAVFVFFVADSFSMRSFLVLFRLFGKVCLVSIHNRMCESSINLFCASSEST